MAGLGTTRSIVGWSEFRRGHDHACPHSCREIREDLVPYEPVQ